MCVFDCFCISASVPSFFPVGYTTDDLQFMWQTGDPVQMDAIALPQFDIRQEDITYGNCTKYYAGTGTFFIMKQYKVFFNKEVKKF